MTSMTLTTVPGRAELIGGTQVGGQGSAVVVVAVVAVVASIGSWYLWQRSRKEARSPEAVGLLRQAKAARKKYHEVQKGYDQETKQRARAVALLESQQGATLASLGGVTLYERWVTTPQGSGSILGVHAEAADESSVKQRITATRIVALGVFALAAPKKKGVGNAYVVIDGPHVSGVATMAGGDNQAAGPSAYAFAAKINNAARAAEAAEPTRPACIEQAQADLNHALNYGAVLVSDAGQAYKNLVTQLPPEFAAKFGDVPG